MQMNYNLDELNPSVEDILSMEEEQRITEEKIEYGRSKKQSTKKNVSDDYYLGDSMQLYLAEIGKIPLLTSEEEIELGRIIKEGGEAALQARNDLINANLRLVVHYAKRFLGRGVEFEDLNAMGIEGLFKAAEKYDYTMGYKFSTYASWWINQAISRGIADEASIVRIPIHMNEVMHKVRKAQKFLNQEYGEEPTVGEIAEYLSIPEKTVLAAFGAMYNIVSFDTKIGEDGDTTLEDFLADENADDPCDVAVDSALKEAVQTVLGQLEPKEALVLSLRNGIGVTYPMTLEEIANLPEFGVTRERVRQIENKALRRIQRSPKMMNLLRDFVA